MWKYNYYIVGILCLLVVIIYNSYTTEGFTDGLTFQSTKWPDDLIQQFIKYQKTLNQNVNQFNMDILQQQAGTEEVTQLLKTGFWPWTDELKREYLNKVRTIPIIKIEPQHALNYAMKIYNQRAALELLSWNTKEGEFLLYGGDLGVSSGEDFNLNVSLNQNVVHNTIKCVTDVNGTSSLQKKTNSTTEKITNENIPTEMPGFSFIKDSCNPCVALNDVADFSCPFTLNIKGDNTTSASWATLWGL